MISIVLLRVSCRTRWRNLILPIIISSGLSLHQLILDPPSWRKLLHVWGLRERTQDRTSADARVERRGSTFDRYLQLLLWVGKRP